MKKADHCVDLIAASLKFGDSHLHEFGPAPILVVKDHPDFFEAEAEVLCSSDEADSAARSVTSVPHRRDPRML